MTWRVRCKGHLWYPVARRLAIVACMSLGVRLGLVPPRRAILVHRTVCMISPKACGPRSFLMIMVITDDMRTSPYPPIPTDRRRCCSPGAMPCTTHQRDVHQYLRLSTFEVPGTYVTPPYTHWPFGSVCHRRSRTAPTTPGPTPCAWPLPRTGS